MRFKYKPTIWGGACKSRKGKFLVLKPEKPKETPNPMGLNFTAVENENEYEPPQEYEEGHANSNDRWASRAISISRWWDGVMEAIMEELLKVISTEVKDNCSCQNEEKCDYASCACFEEGDVEYVEVLAFVSFKGEIYLPYQ